MKPNERKVVGMLGMNPMNQVRYVLGAVVVLITARAESQSALCVEPASPSKPRDTLDYANCLVLKELDLATALAEYQRVAMDPRAKAIEKEFALGKIERLKHNLATLINGSPTIGGRPAVESITLKRIDVPAAEREVKQWQDPVLLMPGTYKVVIHRKNETYEVEQCLGAGSQNNVDEWRPKVVLTCPAQLDCNDKTCTNQCEWTKSQARKHYPCPVSPPMGAPALIRESGAGNMQRGTGIGLGIAGLVSSGVGVGFALAARSNESNSDKHCGAAAGYSDSKSCSSEGLALNRAAQSYEKASYWTVGLGVTALLAGVVSYITAPTSDSFRESSSAVGNPKTFRIVPVVSRESSGLWLQSNW